MEKNKIPQLDYLWYDTQTFEVLSQSATEIRNLFEPAGWKEAAEGTHTDPLRREHREKHDYFPAPQAVRTQHLSTEALIQLSPTSKISEYVQPETMIYQVKILSRNDSIMGGNIYDELVRCYKRQNDKLLQLKHPYILNNLLLLETSNTFYLIRENIENGSLNDLINSIGFIPEQFSQRYFKQILSAVDFMHRNGIIHGNINCENILIDRSDNVRITGIRVHEMSQNNCKQKYFYKGPKVYRAPELSKRKFKLCKETIIDLSEENLRYLVKNVHKTSFNKYVYCLSDIWSLGVLLFVMLWGQEPYTNDEYKDILNGHVLIPEPLIPLKKGSLSISNAAEQLYKKLIVVDLLKRPRTKDILNDEWLKTDLWNLKKVQEKQFDISWRHFYEFQFNNLYIHNESSVTKDLDLAKLRMTNSYKKMNKDSNVVEKKIEKYYAIFIPVNIEGDGWLNDYNGLIFSAIQKEYLKRIVQSDKKCGEKVMISCYKPYVTDKMRPFQIHCQVVGLQSDIFRKRFTNRKLRELIVHPVLGLLQGAQIYHAVLYPMFHQGRVGINNPKYALLYIRPEMIQGLNELSEIQKGDINNYTGRKPKTFEDLATWDYLFSLTNDEEKFTSEFHRLSGPLLQNLRTHLNQTRFSVDSHGQREIVRRSRTREEHRKGKIHELNYCQQRSSVINEGKK